MIEFVERGYIIINVDEFSVSNSTSQNKALSSKRKNIVVNSICLHFHQQGSCNWVRRINASPWISETFCNYIEQLKFKVPNLALLLDQAGWHQSKATLEFLNRISVPVAFCPAKSPQLAPVEHAIGMVKRRYKKERLHADVQWVHPVLPQGVIDQSCKADQD